LGHVHRDVLVVDLVCHLQKLRLARVRFQM